MSYRRHLQIAPSILTSDFTRLGETLEMLNSSQCDYIHLDVMDGVFVPNISFGFPVIRNIAKKAAKPLDVGPLRGLHPPAPQPAEHPRQRHEGRRGAQSPHSRVLLRVHR